MNTSKQKEFVERRQAAHRAGTASLETDWLVKAAIADWHREPYVYVPSVSAMEPGAMFRRQAD